MTTPNVATVEPTRSTRLCPAPPGRMLVNVSVLEQKYSADKRSIYRWADAGIIPFGIKLSGLRRWDLAEIDAHIAAGCPTCRPTTKARVK